MQPPPLWRLVLTERGSQDANVTVSKIKKDTETGPPAEKKELSSSYIGVLGTGNGLEGQEADLPPKQRLDKRCLSLMQESITRKQTRPSLVLVELKIRRGGSAFRLIKGKIRSSGLK